MKILVTGACGLLGGHIGGYFSQRHQVVGVDRNTWWGDRPIELIQGDLCAKGFIVDCIERTHPDVIIHCAAMVDVDACEQNAALAHQVNAEVTRSLVQAAPSQSLFVYVATDGLFKGDHAFAAENDPPCPKTEYARSKVHGEWATQLATENHLIVRTNFYGWSSGRKKTAAEWLHNALLTGQRITLYEDFFFSPIYVADFVRLLSALIDSGERGTFHLAGKDRVSKYEFGEMMAKCAGLQLNAVTRGAMKDSSFAVQRPRDMSLGCGRFERLLNLDVPSCQAGIRNFISHRDRPLSRRFDG